MHKKYSQKEEIILVMLITTLIYTGSTLLSLALSLMLKSRMFIYMINILLLILFSAFVSIAYPSHAKYSKRKVITPALIGIALYELQMYKAITPQVALIVGLIVLFMWNAITIKQIYDEFK